MSKSFAFMIIPANDRPSIYSKMLDEASDDNVHDMVHMVAQEWVEANGEKIGGNLRGQCGTTEEGHHSVIIEDEAGNIVCNVVSQEVVVCAIPDDDHIADMLRKFAAQVVDGTIGDSLKAAPPHVLETLNRMAEDEQLPEGLRDSIKAALVQTITPAAPASQTIH